MDNGGGALIEWVNVDLKKCLCHKFGKFIFFNRIII